MTRRVEHRENATAAAFVLAGLCFSGALSGALSYALSGVWPGAANAATFTITPGSEGTLVVFESKAPMESFTGRTSAISGQITLDPAALADSVSVEVSVDLLKLDTGIDLRNQHMRENHLHTDRFPRAIFRGAKLIGEHPARLESGQAVTLQIAGEFECHGVKKPLTTPVEVKWDAETNRVHFATTFVVFLADHDIPRPKMLFVKLDEKQTVTFTAVAAPVAEAK